VEPDGLRRGEVRGGGGEEESRAVWWVL